MTTILHKYTDYMAIAEIGGGYDIPASEIRAVRLYENGHSEKIE